MDNSLAVDLTKLNPLALEITKSYLSLHGDSRNSSPKEFTKIFYSTYSRIAIELELMLADKDLLKSMVNDAIDSQ